jgi:hypothetical protein
MLLLRVENQRLQENDRNQPNNNDKAVRERYDILAQPRNDTRDCNSIKRKNKYEYDNERIIF